MDISGWLRSLGLVEYETEFRKNKVDASILPKLTADDLKDLGVAAVGDRRKLLEAIEVLRERPRSPSRRPQKHLRHPPHLRILPPSAAR
jgi:hypothetical protein